MRKGTQEQIARKREEIINACEQLYQTMSFREITLKEIGNITSFSRPTIYNYFETKEELFYLEEPYVPHPLAGVMAQNKPAAAKEKHVWSTGDQKIGK